MSSPLKRLTLGRKSGGGDEARAAMLSRLGIAEEKPRDLFRAEPQPPVEPAPRTALAPESAPAPSGAWMGQPANDEHIPPMPAEAPAPRRVGAAPAVETVETVEDPLEAIRRQYRKQPAGLPQLPAGLPKLPAGLPSLPRPSIRFRFARPGARRRKAGELPTVRRVIWGLSWAAGLSLGWALLTADANSPVVRAFVAMLP